MIAVTQTKDHTQVYSPDGLAALFAACEQKCVLSANECRMQTKRDGQYGSWHGAPAGATNWAGLKNLLTHGWAAGAEKVRAGIGQVQTPVMRSVRRRGRWAETGDELSLDRMYAGQLDTMWRTTSRQQVTAPSRVRIVADVGALADVPAGNLFWRGAAASALANTLQAAGYAVQVEAAWYTVKYTELRGNETFGIQHVVKPWDKPTTLSMLAASIACVTFYRGVLFSAICRWAPEPVGEHIGYTRAVRPEYLVPCPGAVTLIVPQSVLSAGAAREWVTQQVAALEAGTAGVA